jgi:hypothetical protein
MNPTLILILAELAAVLVIGLPILAYRMGQKRPTSGYAVASEEIRHFVPNEEQTETATGMTLRVLEPPTAVIDEMPPSDLAPLIGTEIIINTSEDRSIQGVLVLTTTEHLVLRKAKLLDENRAPVAMDGEQWIRKDKVEFFQKPSAEAVA